MQKLSEGQKGFLIFIAILLVVLSGIGIGYGLYKNKLYSSMVNTDNEEKIYYLENEEIGIKIGIHEKCENCILLVKKVDDIRKGIIATYKLEVFDKNNNQVFFNDLDMVIMIPVNDDLSYYTDYKMLYIEDDEILKTYSTYVDDNYIIIRTSQLGTYGIMGTILVK